MAGVQADGSAVVTATMIDEEFLDERLGAVEQARTWSPRVLSKLEALLRSEDHTLLWRINPLAFAAERGINEREAVDLFLHAAKAGLLTIQWHLLCPGCGMAVENFDSLRSVHREFYCSLCMQPTTAQLDDFIQITFTVAPRVRTIRYHHPQSLDVTDYVMHYRLSREARWGDGGPAIRDLITSSLLAASWLEPGQRRAFTASVVAGIVNSAELTAHLACELEVEGAALADGATQQLLLTVSDDALRPDRASVSPGPLQLELHNASARRVAVLVGNKPLEMLKEHADAAFSPFLRGSTLLTNQTFRQLFRGEVIQGAEGIGIRDVTIVFTDLKSSTQLYERIGDLKAFELVRRHFDGVARAIAQNGGALVKTIGDAVMAAFTRASDAIAAAIAMQDEIDRFNAENGGREIVLKIGMHRGASIAVTLNESLDYFGQTVNVAARVQGLAGADEILLTEDVFQATGVQPLLVGTTITPEDARLRGIEKQVRVHRVVRGRPQPGTGAGASV
ncbi:MAG: adenylate/guanylate cyclase domain-containing protein [Deltaproteobacteria bacterium]|nr:adenylate/guanylate cyclase domain-containing protein [Deltaproteobacteria bacterium]